MSLRLTHHGCKVHRVLGCVLMDGAVMGSD